MRRMNETNKTTTSSFARTAGRRGHRRSGFTLIELMVSMVIMGITVVSVVSIHNTTLQQHMHSQDLLVANSLADQFLELVQVDALRWKDGGQIAQTWYLQTSGRRKESNTVSNPNAVFWISATKKPVNFQMRSLDQVAPNGNKRGRNARFCIFYSFRPAGFDSTVRRAELKEINVIVLWPRQMTGLPVTGTAASVEGVNLKAFYDSCGTSSPNDPNTLLNSTTQSTIDAIQIYFKQIRRVTYIRQGIMK